MSAVPWYLLVFVGLWCGIVLTIAAEWFVTHVWRDDDVSERL